MATGIQIGLNSSKKGVSASSKPAPARRKPAFGEEDDEDDDRGNLLSNAHPTSNKPKTPITKSVDVQEITTFDEDDPTPTNNDTKQLHAPKLSTTKPTLNPKFSSRQHTEASPNLSTLRSQNQQTADVDPSLYDYDGAYDALHSQSRSKGSTATGKPASSDQSYMNDLLAAAELRKRDQLRAKDRLLQKEREAEGEEFKDKDAFVTEAYKAQQEEVKQAEAAERAREEQEDERRRKGLGMSKFYKSFMDQEEKRHQELVTAAAQATAETSASEPKDPDVPREKSDLELAAELRKQGKDVGINDEGQLIDKRELLGAGLNVAPKPKSSPLDSNASKTQNASRNDGPAYTGRGDNRNETRQAMRERQSRMMEAQLEAATKRAAEEEAAEQEKLERTAKSRKTDGEISSARERYLQRKREAQAAAAKGE